MTENVKKGNPLVSAMPEAGNTKTITFHINYPAALCLQIKQYCSNELKEIESQGNRLEFQPEETGDKVEECLETKLMEGKIEQTSECGRVGEGGIAMLFCVDKGGWLLYA